MLDPYLCKEVKVSNLSYWSNKDKFKVLISSKKFIKFSVLEIDRKPILNNESYKLVSLSVLKNDSTEIIETRTHLGKTIKEDDILLGYDLTNFNTSIEDDNMPDYLLVRKNPVKNINWKVKVTSDEYYYFLDDIKKDKEIVNNLCEVPVENKDLIENLEKLLNY